MRKELKEMLVAGTLALGSIGTVGYIWYDCIKDPKRLEDRVGHLIIASAGLTGSYVGLKYFLKSFYK